MQMSESKLGALVNVMAAMPQPNEMPSQEGAATG